MDKKCPFYLFKCEVIATQTRRKLTPREAEEEVRERFSEEGKQFNFAARKKPVSSASRNNEDTVERTENSSEQESRVEDSEKTIKGAESVLGSSQEPLPPLQQKPKPRKAEP